ncbi:MAG TPA: zinc-dependent alcohol dehydrogenase family protein [Fimbriimonadales bacterium]|nr:zinc-dependent alcohol dehydrogenase family protein [Fimbriimonadales bacterium]
MKAMVCKRKAYVEEHPLELMEVPEPSPPEDSILIDVEVCGVCRTDLHVIEGELPVVKEPVIPGHQVIGRRIDTGERVGVAWLHKSCGECRYCKRGDENLCDSPLFTGYHVDGGYAEKVAAHPDFIYPIPEGLPSLQAAPLICAGIIGYRVFVRSRAKKGSRLALYGFGASAHIVIQIALHFGCEVFVITRGEKHRALAKEMGASWVGDASERPPVKFDSAILFAPAGELVPLALEALDKGGTLACSGIYMSQIPPLDYTEHLFQERTLTSVTANTRQDGYELFRLAVEIPIRTHVEEFPLESANDALVRLKNDEIRGAAVLRVT